MERKHTITGVCTKCNERSQGRKEYLNVFLMQHKTHTKHDCLLLANAETQTQWRVSKFFYSLMKKICEDGLPDQSSWTGLKTIMCARLQQATHQQDLPMMPTVNFRQLFSTPWHRDLLSKIMCMLSICHLAVHNFTSTNLTKKFIRHLSHKIRVKSYIKQREGGIKAFKC